MVRRGIVGAPSYDEVDYWEKRFTRFAKTSKSSEQDGIEWLGDGGEIVNAINDILNDANQTQEFGHILHLGAGASDLSLSIAELLFDNKIPLNRLINIDFAPSALDIGQMRMNEWLNKKGILIRKDEEMQFCCADLRDWNSLKASFTEKGFNVNKAPFSILIDKSTCDSLATANQIDSTSALKKIKEYPILKELLSLSLKAQGKIGTDKIDTFDAIDLVAFHLAALTKSNSVWLAMSYSEDRFEFLQNTSNFTLSRPFWKVEQTKIIIAPSGSSNHFAPNIYHHFTILKRL